MKPMKIVILSLLTITCTLSVFSQKTIVILYPLIGDTIEQSEKQTFLLFPELKDSLFEYGQIFFEDGKYTLYTFSKSGNKQMEVDSLKLQQYYINIEKLIAYHSYLENSDSLKTVPLVIVNQKDTCALEMDIEYLSPKLRKRLSKDSNRYQELKSKADEMGFWGINKDNYIHTSGYFEIMISKSKTKN